MSIKQIAPEFVTRALWCKVLVLLLSTDSCFYHRDRVDSHEYREKESQDDTQIWTALPVHTNELGSYHCDEADKDPSDGPQKCGRGIFRKERRSGVHVFVSVVDMRTIRTFASIAHLAPICQA